MDPTLVPGPRTKSHGHYELFRIFSNWFDGESTLEEQSYLLVPHTKGYQIESTQSLHFDFDPTITPLNYHSQSLMGGITRCIGFLMARDGNTRSPSNSTFVTQIREGVLTAGWLAVPENITLELPPLAWDEYSGRICHHIPYYSHEGGTSLLVLQY